MVLMELVIEISEVRGTMIQKKGKSGTDSVAYAILNLAYSLWSRTLVILLNHDQKNYSSFCNYYSYGVLYFDFVL